MKKITLISLIIGILVVGGLILFYVIGTQPNSTGSSTLQEQNTLSNLQKPAASTSEIHSDTTGKQDATIKKKAYAFETQKKISNLGCGFRDNEMNPARIKVGLGSKISWFNYGKNTHRVVVEGLFETAPIRPGTASTYYSLNKKGKFSFYLKDKPEIKGVITVN
ncbi:hypothetical protein J7J81_00625 [bacterium]|nr:hypothetical protein [bacterium]